MPAPGREDNRPAATTAKQLPTLAQRAYNSLSVITLSDLFHIFAHSAADASAYSRIIDVTVCGNADFLTIQ
jgi:hypothetical protein